MNLSKPSLATALAAMAFAVGAVWSRYRAEVADWRAGQRAAAERHASQPVPPGGDFYLHVLEPQPGAEPRSDVSVSELLFWLAIAAALVLGIALFTSGAEPSELLQLLQVSPDVAVRIAELLGTGGR